MEHLTYPAIKRDFSGSFACVCMADESCSLDKDIVRDKREIIDHQCARPPPNGRAWNYSHTVDALFRLLYYYLLLFHMSIKRADLVYNYRACWVHHTNSCESRRLRITAEVNDIDPVLMNAGGHKNRLITSQTQKSKKLKPICSLLFFQMLQVSKAPTDPGSDPCDICSDVNNQRVEVTHVDLGGTERSGVGVGCCCWPGQVMEP